LLRKIVAQVALVNPPAYQLQQSSEIRYSPSTNK